MSLRLTKVNALHTVEIDLPTSYDSSEGIPVDLSSYFGTPLLGAWVLENCLGGLLFSVAETDLSAKKFQIRVHYPRAKLTPGGLVSEPKFTGEKSITTGISAGTPEGSVSTPVFIPSSGMTSDISAGTPNGSVSTAKFHGKQSETTKSEGGTPHGFVSKPEFIGDALPTHGHTFLGDYPAIAFPLAPSGRNSVEPAGIPTGEVSQPYFEGEPLPSHRHLTTCVGEISEQSFQGEELAPHKHEFSITGENGPVTFTGKPFPSHIHEITPSGSVSSPRFTGELIVASKAEEIDNGTDLCSITGRNFITIGFMV
jgi:hypothetical protein